MDQVIVIAVAGVPAIYLSAWVASKAFFQAKYEYHKRLVNYLHKGDQQ